MPTINIRQTMAQPVAESGSALLTWNLVDELGAPIQLTQVGTARYWLYDEDTGSVVNSRSNVDIKNLNGGSIHATTGACTLGITPLDSELLDQASAAEWKVAFVRITYNGGAGVVEKEIAFRVVALRFSP
jgi:hypothetical protein